MQKRVAQVLPSSVDLGEGSINGEPEAGQQIGKRELIVAGKTFGRLVGEMQLHSFAFRVDHADDLGSGCQVFSDLLQDFCPTIVRRTDLDNQLGRSFQILGGQGSFGNRAIADKRHVRSTHRVGTALHDYTRVITDNVTNVVGTQILLEQVR